MAEKLLSAAEAKTISASVDYVTEIVKEILVEVKAKANTGATRIDVVFKYSSIIYATLRPVYFVEMERWNLLNGDGMDEVRIMLESLGYSVTTPPESSSVFDIDWSKA